MPAGKFLISRRQLNGEVFTSGVSYLIPYRGKHVKKFVTSCRLHIIFYLEKMNLKKKQHFLQGLLRFMPEASLPTSRLKNRKT